ncbi:MAG: hypothetical protein J5I53_07465 [Bradyrhizobiaceae bacterium]|nr:hypothetical protein [Bradyrhizobiaceae bacterium]
MYLSSPSQNIAVEGLHDCIFNQLLCRQKGTHQRLELGQDSVQGIDYAYTINGWLKGINMPSLQPDHDPGGDGAESGPNTGFARGAFGMAYHPARLTEIE